MKIELAAIALLIAAADAFVAPNSQGSAATSALSAYRHNSYLLDLENLRTEGIVKVNGQPVNPTVASTMIDQEIQDVEHDSMQAEGRVTSLLQEINDTNQEIQDAKEERSKSLQKELDIAIYEAREKKLQGQLKVLSAKLEEEQEHIKLNQLSTNRILQRRIELDQELGQLQKKYEEDSRSWEAKLEQEKLSHGRDVAHVQAEVEKLRKQVEEMANRADPPEPAEPLNPYVQSETPPTKLNPFVHTDPSAETTRTNPFVTTKALVSRSLQGTRSLASRSLGSTKALASKSLDSTKALASKSLDSTKALADRAKSLANLSVEKVRGLTPSKD